jgi:hypothetical protein
LETNLPMANNIEPRPEADVIDHLRRTIDTLLLENDDIREHLRLLRVMLMSHWRRDIDRPRRRAPEIFDDAP